MKTSTQIELSTREEKRLDDLAKTSPFWGSIRARYAEWGALTARQHELFVRDCERAEWQKDAQRIAGGTPIRNKFRVGGKPRCAHRAEQCQSVATVVVGTFGYCAAHEADATEELTSWKHDRDAERSERDGAPAVAEDDAEAEEDA